MKNVSVCVLTLAAIFIGTVYVQAEPTEFLLKYGYLTEKSGNNRAENPTPEEMEKAILQFQRFTGLPQTGMMDETTVKKMVAPRCGVKDVNEELAEFRAVSKWPKNLITWKLKKYSRTSRLSRGQQRRAMSQALKRWADVSPLVFRETGGKPTLAVSFENRRHGDGHAFDGRGNVLAHAFFPQNGATHFDDDENWISGKTGGIDLETVAAHEFGHALGLGHSAEKKSLMAPYYQTFPDNFKLHSDDEAGIQKLYGKKPIGATASTPRGTTARSTPPTTDRRDTTTRTPPRGHGFCNYSYRRIDAAMRISGNDFVFVDNGAVIDGRNGQKMAVKSLFPGGPKWVQAAVYSKQTRTAYLFKDEKVWAYTLSDNEQFSLVKNFPKRNSNRYSHTPESAIQFNYYNSERIFLMKNGYFFEFMPYYGNVTPGRGYQSRAFFVNIPSRIDATISSDSNVHFIVKNKAYKMPNNERRVSIQGKPANLAFNKCQN